VQSVENDSLTGGYKSNFPFFHKLFLKGVENFSDTKNLILRKSGPSKKTCVTKKPPEKAASYLNRITD